MNGKELHDAIEAQLVLAGIRPQPRNWEDRPSGVRTALESVARSRYGTFAVVERARRSVKTPRQDDGGGK